VGGNPRRRDQQMWRLSATQLREAGGVHWRRIGARNWRLVRAFEGASCHSSICHLACEPETSTRATDRSPLTRGRRACDENVVSSRVRFQEFGKRNRGRRGPQPQVLLACCVSARPRRPWSRVTGKEAVRNISPPLLFTVFFFLRELLFTARHAGYLRVSSFRQASFAPFICFYFNRRHDEKEGSGTARFTIQKPSRD
jgi:hypothetical protein